MRLITFDFWNTLFLDKHEGIRHNRRISFAHQKFCRYRDLPLSEVQHAFSAAHDRFMNQWESRNSFTMSEHVQEIVNRVQIELAPSEFDQVVDYFETILLEFPPVIVPNAATAVQYCASRMKVGLISDTGYTPGRILRKILANHDLAASFNAFSFSNETGVLKPHVETFQKILTELDLPADQAVHIGDLEESDITGAKKIGMKAIKYIGSNPSAVKESIADAVIEDLGELPRVLEGLQKGS